MHQPIRDSLEDHLRGRSRESLQAFHAHLAACESCRLTVNRMERQASLLRAFRLSEAVEPAPGFYARVVQRIEAQPKPSLWALLLDPGFGRKLVYASLTAVVLLSTYLISTDSAQIVAESEPVAEVMLADQNSDVPLGQDQQRDRDAILVSLTTYKE